jgi:alkylated DNA repair dioxygenase AlkB
VGQTALFPPPPRVLLDDAARGCRVDYRAAFLPADEADRLFAELRDHAPWQGEAPVVFGRATLVRRRTCAYGDPGLRYRYSGLERVAHPWPPSLVALVERLVGATGTRFNFALGNLYPDGMAGLGWHADDERDLVPGQPIGSISLGAERDFAMRLGRSGAACLTACLEHGSLLVMAGNTQRCYQHRVPARRRCDGARINLTFRSMVPPAGGP